jgi:D-serine deaminase-like pyridoxal phosphate-dependent protein
MHIDRLETPVAIVDLDKLQANISKLQKYMDEHKIDNRPHIKTHKIPEIAHLQVNAGAVGITCQKIGEAEVMSQGGIKDIFIPYNILGEAKLERLMHLTRRVKISVTADSEVTVRGLAAASQKEGSTLPVLVEFDGGFGRCGVQSPQEAADLARVIARSAGLHFGGLMTYPNNEQTDPFVGETKALLANDGLAVERVSGGSTKGMWQAHTHQEITEHRAGMYAYGDRNMVKGGVMKFEDCAFRVITTVVSRPTADRGILDGGSKTFSMDTFAVEGYGYLMEYPEAHFHAISEEHGHIDFSKCDRKPEIGERVTVITNHCCVANNLFREIVGVRNEQVEVIWPVAAHGMLQ